MRDYAAASDRLANTVPARCSRPGGCAQRRIGTRSQTLMSPGLIILILSLLLGLQPITTDLYLPALPALTEGFGAPMAQAQLTALLLAFGLSQLIWGPL